MEVLHRKEVNPQAGRATCVSNSIFRRVKQEHHKFEASLDYIVGWKAARTIKPEGKGCEGGEGGGVAAAKKLLWGRELSTSGRMLGWQS